MIPKTGCMPGNLQNKPVLWISDVSLLILYDNNIILVDSYKGGILYSYGECF